MARTREKKASETRRIFGAAELRSSNFSEVVELVRLQWEGRAKA